MKTITKIQIRFGDVDMAHVVHNAAYLYYFEQGRIDFFHEHLTDKNWDWKKKGLIVGRNEVDYLIPIRLNDEVYVETTCDHVSNKSFTLSYHIYNGINEENRKLLAKGRSILVCMNYEENKSVTVYKEWRDKLVG